MKYDIEILIYCHNFQKRLCWVLSSIVEQRGTLPRILINIASLGNNGAPSTEMVCTIFSQWLNIRHTLFESRDVFAYPSLTKNRQIQNSFADWIMCHSADQVFHRDYFAALWHNLQGAYKNADNCIASPNKVFSRCEETEQLIRDTPGEFIENAYEKARMLPLRGKRAWHRAGGHLIFRRDTIMEKADGYYVTREACRDRHLFRRGMRSRSDMGFRRRMGGVTYIDLPMQVHLEHRRDKEEGKHLEEQR